MERETPLYKIIYNKILNRILVGIYPKGYQLRSVEKMHAEYNVGYTSIRRALRLLQQEGFIRLEERRRPVVIFDAEDPGCRELRWRVFLSRYQSHLDCCRALPVLGPGLIMVGAEHCGEKALDDLEVLVDWPESKVTSQRDLLELCYTWQTLVIQQADNELANDLFLQIRGFDDLRFIVLPLDEVVPGEVELTRRALSHWTEMLRCGDLKGLHMTMTIFFHRMACSWERDFRLLKDEPEAKSVQPVDFKWYIRQTPEPLYRKIAYDLLQTAEWEGMQPGEYFPSEAALLKQYGVSAVTVRGALAMLNNLGVARTVNGMGTILIGESIHTPEAEVYIRESRESLAILSACGRELADLAGTKIDEKTLRSLCEGVEKYKDKECLPLFLLRGLAGVLSVRSLENVLDQLEARYLFGLTVSGLQAVPERREQRNELFREAEKDLKLLKEGKYRAFTEAFDSFCRKWKEGLF